MNYPLSFYTVFQVFKVLKNLLDSNSHIFMTNFNVFTQTPTPTHPLNGQNLLSMTKNFCCCTLLNYKNESSTNVSKYYRLAIYLQIQNIFVETVFCSFLRQQNFWEICSINIYGRVKWYIYMIRKKWFSNDKHSDSQIV